MTISESNLYDHLQTLRAEVKTLRERVDYLESHLAQEQEKRFILPVLLEPETGGMLFPVASCQVLLPKGIVMKRLFETPKKRPSFY